MPAATTGEVERRGATEPSRSVVTNGAIAPMGRSSSPCDFECPTRKVHEVATLRGHVAVIHGRLPACHCHYRTAPDLELATWPGAWVGGNRHALSFFR